MEAQQREFIREAGADAYLHGPLKVLKEAEVGSGVTGAAQTSSTLALGYTATTS